MTISKPLSMVQLTGQYFIAQITVAATAKAQVMST